VSKIIIIISIIIIVIIIVNIIVNINCEENYITLLLTTEHSV
jgi:hypothetical protein